MTLKSYNRIFWTVFALPFIILITIFTLISLGKLGFMPTFEDLENPKLNVASQLITQDSVVLDKLFLAGNNRINVDYDDLPSHLVKALIATEDIRFHRHSGIDAKGLIRAIFFLGQRGGASTITQQLAKQLFHERSVNFFERVWQKLNEWVIAVKIEKKYTKQEIVALYFNKFDFNNLAIGIKSAAQVYFNKSTDSLDLPESAMLVGMFKNPVLYNPVRFEDTAQYRRNVVLRQMVKYDYIDKQTYDSIAPIPVELDFRKVDHNEAVGAYFRDYVKRVLTATEPQRRNYYNYSEYQKDSAAWIEDAMYGWCNKNLKPNGEPYNIYKDGLKIYTTLNYQMQIYAEQAVKKHLGEFLQPAFFEEKKGQYKAPFGREVPQSQINQQMWLAMRNSERGRNLRNAGYNKKEIIENFKKEVEMSVFTWDGDKDTLMTPFDSILYYKSLLRTGFMAMNPRNGQVRAYVGGPNYRHFKYDHVTQGKRQAGSTFKPFLYILAMQEAYTPCDQIYVVPQTFMLATDSIWEPRSTTKAEDIGTQKTLKWGLAHSDNYVSAWLVKQFKPKPIANIAHKMGIDSEIDPVPSIIYGTSSMTVMEMVGAYSTMANKGVHTEPIVVTKIEDKNGNVLADFQPEKIEAISDETAYLMINLMQGVTQPGGTAARLRWKYGFDAEIAGKTGTTNDNSDGWFIGIVPELVAGCWVGHEDMIVRFDNMDYGQGAIMALPIWGEFMTSVYQDSSLNITQEDTFEKPVDYNYNLDCDERVSEPDEDFLNPLPEFN
ncbi:MAG: penicillin-binding protein [Bacteroidetes bacterium]|jgi:penicillin-binding protein 1A|nr:penicillin-binding protein [Bacteroidota bacterium]